MTLRGFAVERAAACRHLVEHDAEREDVGARVGLASFDLLGRHVGQRAYDGPVGGSAAVAVMPRERRTVRPRFARPKSSSFAPASVSMMLAGLRSRCTMPRWCGD